MNKSTHILVVPLNWGLGHATRMMPVIDQLLTLGYKVSIGGDGRSGIMLKNAYPDLNYYEVPSYNVVYPEGDRFVFKTLSRLPIYINAIKKEKDALKKIIPLAKVDVVISDNRYGLYNKKIKSIFVGHQLGIILPKGFSAFRKALYNLHLYFLKNFDEIWIPDEKGSNNISGKLTHQFELPKKSRFIGPLSRFNEIKKESRTTTSIPILVVLSGPEPQRSIFQMLVENQAMASGFSLTVVEGKAEENYDIQSNNIRRISFANTALLHRLLNEAELVICRSGYSSIMDLYVLGKKVVFVPTPGQTEQEYLAKRLKKQNIAYFQYQSDFNLEEAIIKSQSYAGFESKNYKMEALLHTLRTL